jgi:flagellin
MALYFNTNVSSLEAQRSLSANTMQQAVTFQRLSSGLRINTAADDAAGLAISERMSAAVRSRGRAKRTTPSACRGQQKAR